MDNQSTLQTANTFATQSHGETFGRNVSLAMALVQGGVKDSPQKNGSAIPEDTNSIRVRLKQLSKDMSSIHADLLELLVRFDDSEGWKSNGSKHCAAWMNTEIGLSLASAWEYLRVGRKLRKLLTLRALFRVGKLSWSKVRLISRVANEANENILCHAALDASVTDVQLLCQGYHWDDDESHTAENSRAMQQWNSRSLTWQEINNGSTRIQITLPPELAQAFLNSVEQSINQLDITATNASQRRADAAVLMAEKSLQSEGRDIATADRYQVVVSVDATELSNHSESPHNANKLYPPKRASIHNAGPIAKETARRIACDCSVSVNTVKNGEPTNIGRKSRIWPTAMARAIKERDQVCVWPGCIQSRHLHIHHIKHWADGGETSVSNGACLCSYHHTLVHEGGYTLFNVEDDEKHAEVQFTNQLNKTDVAQFDFEMSLRNNKAAFELVRKLMPMSYRFRVVDPDGIDVGANMEANYEDVLGDSTRDECREPTIKYNITHNLRTRKEPFQLMRSHI